MQFKTIRNYATTWRIYRRNIEDRKWEPEAPFMKHCVREGDVCLHFGASDGRHSYLLSKAIGASGIVHAYEASSYSYKIMARLLRWHGLKNVVPHHAAMGASEGMMTLTVPRKRSGHIGRAYGVVGQAGRKSSEADLATSNDTEFYEEPVRTVSLDGVMAENKLDRVDFIRCDIEGSEINMIRGGRATIEKHLPGFLLEIHPFSLEQFFGSNAEEVRGYFLGLGYKGWQLNDADELVFDDRIDTTRRWKDYFFIHPSKAHLLPEGPFKRDLLAGS